MPRKHLATLTGSCLLLTVLFLPASFLGADDTPAAAQKYGGERKVLTVQPDGLFICEGEEFQVKDASAGAGWSAKPFGENYYGV